MAAAGRVERITSSEEAVQIPFEIVQRAVTDGVLMVSELVGEAAFPNEPDPLTMVHAPVPEVGVFAASTKLLLQFS